jgi:DNA-binding IscR family transcriptional regulator
MTRQEICAYAAKHMRVNRREIRNQTRMKVYELTVKPITVPQVMETIGITKTYARELMLELVGEGLLSRTEGAYGTYRYWRTK